MWLRSQSGNENVNDLNLGGDFSYPSGRLLPRLTCHHTAAGNRLKQLLDLWGAVDKLVRPELEGGVLDQLDEGDEQAPGVWPVYNQPLQ